MGFSLYEEAFVIGFTMGNDTQTRRIHIIIFKLLSSLLYPKNYRFNQNHLQVFDLGVSYGRSVKVRNLNKIDFRLYLNESLVFLRSLFGIGCRDYSLKTDISSNSSPLELEEFRVPIFCLFYLFGGKLADKTPGKSQGF
jgi:hypothetical protein